MMLAAPVAHWLLHLFAQFPGAVPQRLLGCEQVKLEFTPEAIKEIAVFAEQLNKEVRLVRIQYSCWGQSPNLGTSQRAKGS
jgi:hypothetical protein